MFFLASRGYRCIAHDRRGHGRSEKPWRGHALDTYADDLAELVQKLDLKSVIHIGHSTGASEIARYIGRHGTKRVAKTILIAAAIPALVRSESNPEGIPLERFEEMKAQIINDRSTFFKDLCLRFYGYNRDASQPSESVCLSFWLEAMKLGLPAACFSIDVMSRAHTAKDLGFIDVPTLIIHGDDDQIIPIGASALTASGIIKTATLKIFKGAPHGVHKTRVREINADVLRFLTSGDVA